MSSQHASQHPLDVSIPLDDHVHHGDAGEQKVLWRKSPYPDNHVPSNFLSFVKERQAAISQRKSSPSFPLLLLHKSLPQTTYISFISIFISVFRALLEGRISSGQIVECCFIVGLIALLSIRVVRWYHRDTFPPRPTWAKPTTSTVSSTLLLPPLVLYLLSPLLLSLTKATTSDSIWPLAGGLFFLGGVLGGFHAGERREDDVVDVRPQVTVRRSGSRKDTTGGKDGRKKPARRASVVGSGPESADLTMSPDKSLRSSLSLTSTISACIVLASRLESAREVFALLGFVAIGMGALIWLSRRRLSRRFQVLITSVLFVTALMLWTPMHSHQRYLGPLSQAQVLLIAAVGVLCGVGPGGMKLGWRWRVV